MENSENASANVIQKRYLKILEALHSLIFQQKLTHNKAISEIRIDDLISTFLKEESEELPEAICNKLKERVLIAKKKELVWEKRKSLILEQSKGLGVILSEKKLSELIFQVPYNCNSSFNYLLETEIQKWKKDQTEILKKMEQSGLSGTIPNLNTDKKIKFRVSAVFEVEYFKGKDIELIDMLKRRLQEANFKSMPQIRVEPITEVKQLTMTLE